MVMRSPWDPAWTCAGTAGRRKAQSSADAGMGKEKEVQARDQVIGQHEEQQAPIRWEVPP